MTRKQARIGDVSMQLVRGRHLPASVRARLGCTRSATVEMYQYHRPLGEIMHRTMQYAMHDDDQAR